MDVNARSPSWCWIDPMGGSKNVQIGLVYGPAVEHKLATCPRTHEDLMPRRSAASLTVVPLATHRPRIQAPSGLSAVEHDLFQKLVVQCPSEQFTASDAPLLVAYVQAVLLSRWAFKEAVEDSGALPTWERACKTMAVLATKLRLCPHSRADAKTITRRGASHQPSVYDMMGLADD